MRDDEITGEQTGDPQRRKHMNIIALAEIAAEVFFGVISGAAGTLALCFIARKAEERKEGKR